MDKSPTLRLQMMLDAHADEAELADRTQALLNELRDLEPRLSVVPQSAPEQGAKDAGQAFSMGQIVMGLIASGGVVSTVIAGVQAWLLRNTGAEIEVEIDGDKIRLKGASDADRDRLIRAFVKRHNR